MGSQYIEESFVGDAMKCIFSFICQQFSVSFDCSTMVVELRVRGLAPGPLRLPRGGEYQVTTQEVSPRGGLEGARGAGGC